MESSIITSNTRNDAGLIGVRANDNVHGVYKGPQRALVINDIIPLIVVVEDVNNRRFVVILEGRIGIRNGGEHGSSQRGDVGYITPFFLFGLEDYLNFCWIRELSRP